MTLTRWLCAYICLWCCRVHRIDTQLLERIAMELWNVTHPTCQTLIGRNHRFLWVSHIYSNIKQLAVRHQSASLTDEVPGPQETDAACNFSKFGTWVGAQIAVASWIWICSKVAPKSEAAASGQNPARTRRSAQHMADGGAMLEKICCVERSSCLCCLVTSLSSLHLSLWPLQLGRETSSHLFGVMFPMNVLLKYLRRVTSAIKNGCHLLSSHSDTTASSNG